MRDWQQTLLYKQAIVMIVTVCVFCKVKTVMFIPQAMACSPNTEHYVTHLPYMLMCISLHNIEEIPRSVVSHANLYIPRS